MIGRLKGFILEKHSPIVLVEVNGVGYEVYMPITCFYALPEEGKEVVILTHLIIRDDTYLLYGFNHLEERTLFKNLIKINGVGPKLALVILSGISIQQFIAAVEQKDTTNLIKLPGISKKIAERLIIEMQDRFKKQNASFLPEKFFTKNNISFPSNTMTQHQVRLEAVAALIALGYKPSKANHTINKIFHKDVDSKTLICNALRLLAL